MGLPGRFLANIDSERLDLSEEDPLKRYDHKAFESLPFEAYAVAHPSLFKAGPRKEVTELFAGKCWRVFPCYTNEIPDAGDTTWAKQLVRHLDYTTLTREPMPACRWARYRPSTPTRSTKRRRAPGKARTIRRHDRRIPMPVRNLVEECYEVESWKGDVLRFANGEVTLEPDGPSYPVGGITEAKDVVLQQEHPLQEDRFVDDHLHHRDRPLQEGRLVPHRQGLHHQVRRLALRHSNNGG